MNDVDHTEVVHKSPAKRALWWGAGTFALGLLIGVVTLGAIRFFGLKTNAVHYHANFALYVDGQRDEFKPPTYYEEVQICSQNNSNNPRARVHLHDEDPYTVHAHDTAVTWGALFANVGYTLGDTVLKTGSGVYADGQDGKQLKFVLNGESVSDIANRVIKDQDVLLVNYGDQNQEALQREYKSIPHTAKQHDETKDPAACSGSDEVTIKDRLKAAVGVQ